MQLLLNCKAFLLCERSRPLKLKPLLAMKMLCFFLTAFTLQIGARGYSQITVKLKDAPLERLFLSIEQQSPYSFVYTREAIEQSKPITIDVKNETLENVLKIAFDGQALTYSFHERYIIIKISSKKNENIFPLLEVKGKVLNEQGEPLAGASVIAKKSNIGTSTNEDGEFALMNVQENDVLVVSSIGHVTSEIPVNNQVYFTVKLKVAVGKLDEAIVMAYGQTTRRLNLGNISKVSSEEISKQPVSNPLAALQGRVPGLVITQTSGVPGAAIDVEIRGRSSLDLSLSRNDPLFIIDGVPFEPGNLVSNQLASAANKPTSTNLGGLSPLNIVNPLDIESIEVLKDADATAIYGSRGANGVIIITTKRGKSGKTKLSVNVSSGWSKASRTMDMLNTSEYLAMRREAFMNDGFTPQVTMAFGNGYAPDLLILDTTIDTDFKKILIGGTARTTNIDASLSGGSDNTFFMVSGSFRKETNVFSDDLSDRRASLHFNVNHRSLNKKFEARFSGFFSNDKNRLIQTDLTQFINLPPNFVLYDAVGKPAFTQQGVPLNYINLGLGAIPSAELLKRYTSINENVLGSFQVSYKLLKNLSLRLNSGYNKFTSDEVISIPRTAINPATTQLAFSKFGFGSSVNWNIDPQLEYSKVIMKGKISFLLGSTFLERTTKSHAINANNYTSDLLLNSIAAAGQITSSNNFSQYKYTAFFGRLNFNWDDKYLFNLSARRDGSSRFGPEKRFSNFGAIGAGWIFSDESFFKAVRFISFGKIRFSYGVTGNDQIGNYKFLDLWTPVSTTYQAIPGLQPFSLFNPNYEWERNKKMEVGIELGALKDRILISTSYYRNRSSNQLINYQLPDQTGFTSITRNLPALVQNSGLEFMLSSKNVVMQNFSWMSSFNITIPRNKLISFPGLASSSYYAFYREGQSLSVINKAKFLGVDPEKGTYIVEDYNKDGNISFPADYQFLGNTDPKLYGGLQNSLDYKQFNFSFFFDFRKKVGRNYLAYINRNPPGIALNQPKIVQERWQKPGDNASIQKLTSQFFGSTAATGATYLSNSNGIYSDASFIRLKNVALSYNLSPTFLSKAKIQSGQIYLHAQNLFFITNYKGSDPETQDIYVLPTLRTVVIGMQLTF